MYHWQILNSPRSFYIFYVIFCAINSSTVNIEVFILTAGTIANNRYHNGEIRASLRVKAHFARFDFSKTLIVYWSSIILNFILSTCYVIRHAEILNIRIFDMNKESSWNFHLLWAWGIKNMLYGKVWNEIFMEHDSINIVVKLGV